MSRLLRRYALLVMITGLIATSPAMAAVPVNDAAQLERKAAASWKSLEMNSTLTRQHQNQTGVTKSLAGIEVPIEAIGVDLKAQLPGFWGNTA